MEPHIYTFEEYVFDFCDFSAYENRVKDWNSKQNGTRIYILENQGKTLNEANFAEYLRGLPNWFLAPYLYEEIRNLMYSFGFRVL